MPASSGLAVCCGALIRQRAAIASVRSRSSAGKDSSIRMTTISGALEWPAPRTTAGTWLISRAGDFWLACAGGGALLVAMAVVLQWHGDRELDTADLLFSELHLGATYDAIARNRLWRRMPFDVVVVPLVIFGLTYVLSFGGYSLVL